MTSQHDAGDGCGVEWLTHALDLAPGQSPYPWQFDLLRRFLRGSPVTAIDIPTGLGKTATMAVWLVARALGATVPRKLVYVVDRRAVIDQATEMAESLRAWVGQERAVADALALGHRPLPISTLRGQHADNREWLEDPSSPAIVVGTIDTVGSRLLFSGYGVTSRMRPYHAGILAADTLVVLDDAPLAPAFEDLLRQIERGSQVFGPSHEAAGGIVPPFRLLSLSATGCRTVSTPLTLADADRRCPTVWKRMTAKKVLEVVDLAVVAEAAATDDDDERDGDAKLRARGRKLAGALAEHAWELANRGSDRIRCLVFCDARKDAIAVVAALRNLATSTNAPEPAIELLVGDCRVRERVQAREALARLGFLAGNATPLERAAFLIATSAGEVGVDLDADHMACDLVGWERMVLRLGRVNRRGDGDAKVIVVMEGEPTASDATKRALAKRDASRAAGRRLDELTKALSAAGGAGKATPHSLQKEEDGRATADERVGDEAEMRVEVLTCRKRIKAFKDTDARTVARFEGALARHRALRKLLKALGEGGSLSPEALLQLRQRQDLAEALHDATTAAPLRPELTRAVVDAWSMTSLDGHPGRPEVDPWLRGFRASDLPQTTVVWRRFLPVRRDGRFDAEAARRFFEAAPPHASEQLEADTHLVRGWLIDRATIVSEAQHDAEFPAARQVAAIALTPGGDVKGWRTLGQLAAASCRRKTESEESKKRRDHDLRHLEDLLAGATLVVDARLGGVTDGLLDGKSKMVVDAADDVSATWLVRSDAPNGSVTGFRVRPLCAGDLGDVDVYGRFGLGDGWVPRFLFATQVVNGELAAALAIDGWVGHVATEDERAEADHVQPLEEHLNWTEECAREIGKQAGLGREYEDLLALAARLHDVGKRAVRWQRAFRAPVHGRPYAKTRGPIDSDILDGYRHELGSLSAAEEQAAVLRLPPDDRDLVLHLIAAHHGYARPFIGTTGCDDAPPSVVAERAREAALRFARLSRRWGPWGLAWWEVLLRAADQGASRRHQRGAGAVTPRESP